MTELPTSRGSRPCSAPPEWRSAATFWMLVLQACDGFSADSFAGTVVFFPGDGK